MLNYILDCALWIFAFYGIIEFVKNIIYIRNCDNINNNGIHLIVGVRNQENKIEGFLRALNFRILYGKEDCVEDIIVLDLNSNDNTKKIVDKISADYSNIISINWQEFEELFSPVKK